MTKTAISLHNVDFAHDGHPVLNSFDLEIAVGTLHVILGPNGSGKSTLLDIIAGFRPAGSGSIRILGLPSEEYSAEKRGTTLAYMPQDEQPGFAYTVREAVMMGRHPHTPRFSRPNARDEAIVAQALDTFDLQKLAYRPITALSGGERQRTALARAIVQDTPLLLLDEPTASMDPKHALDAMTTLSRLCEKGKTVLAVLHDMNLAAAFAHTITVISNGRTVASGAVQTALTPEIIAATFGVEAKVDTDPFTGRPRVAMRIPA